jgi:hypothetical protein
MGLLSADLERHRSGLRKVSHIEKATPVIQKKASAMDILKICLEQFAGADTAMEKSASDDDRSRLFTLHEAVETAYRESVKAGKRPEADTLVDKFAGWKYLKGQPGEAGDLHPFPAPGEK